MIKTRKDLIIWYNEKGNDIIKYQDHTDFLKNIDPKIEHNTIHQDENHFKVKIFFPRCKYETDLFFYQEPDKTEAYMLRF
jgi:hypothetical protein